MAVELTVHDQDAQHESDWETALRLALPTGVIE
mgnify:CR=1 FL=1|jgi:hypothetical protein